MLKEYMISLSSKLVAHDPTVLVAMFNLEQSKIIAGRYTHLTPLSFRLF